MGQRGKKRMSAAGQMTTICGYNMSNKEVKFIQIVLKCFVNDYEMLFNDFEMLCLMFLKDCSMILK